LRTRIEELQTKLDEAELARDEAEEECKRLLAELRTLPERMRSDDMEQSGLSSTNGSHDPDRIESSGARERRLRL